MIEENPYEKIWAQWLQSQDIELHIRNHLSHRRPFLRFMLDFIPRDGRILEVGCGFAIDTAWLASETGSKGFGIDLSLKAVRVALRACGFMGNVPHLAVMDGERLSFPDRAFDVVFSQGVLEHFKDPIPMLTEQARITKPGGYVVVNVPQKYSFYTVYKRRAMKRGSWEYGWETQYSLGGLRRLGKKTGLKAVGWMGYGYEKGRDCGLFEIRSFTKRMAATARYRWMNRWGRLGEKAWGSLENRLGHRFCQNIAVAFTVD